MTPLTAVNWPHSTTFYTGLSHSLKYFIFLEGRGGGKKSFKHNYSQIMARKGIKCQIVPRGSKGGEGKNMSRREGPLCKHWAIVKIS
jgi:hypothetical protein